jgi:hypothetical protein
MSTVFLKDELKDRRNLPGVQFAADITDTANIVRNDRVFKVTLFDSATAKDLTILKADWQVGDYLVVLQFGDGQATILGEDADVKLPDYNKTAGKGLDMYLVVYKIDGTEVFFHIVGGVE